MKRLAALITILLLAATAVAQESKFRAKIFVIQHRSARDIARVIKNLASTSPSADVSANDEMHTITVRDFPENVAVMEEAIGRLDVPAPPAQDVELKISLLIGSRAPLPGPSVPDDLVSVVKQLQSTLRYSHYGLMTANIQRTRSGDGIEGSGVAEATLVGMAASAEHPVFYNYKLRNIRVQSGERPSVGIEKFEFGMRVPVRLEKGTQYQNIGFETPVSVREGEKVVIGTTTMGDRAVIVVLTANIEGK